MFEKEAEEYTDKLTKDWFDGGYSFSVEEVRQAILHFAEFGYKKGQSDQLVHKQYQLNQLRKANEWHYVKDGDLPKETDLLMSKTLLLVTKMKGTDCLSLALGQYNFSTQEFSYQHIVGLTDVVAWKEIVLPKESE